MRVCPDEQELDTMRAAGGAKHARRRWTRSRVWLGCAKQARAGHHESGRWHSACAAQVDEVLANASAGVLGGGSGGAVPSAGGDLAQGGAAR